VKENVHQYDPIDPVKCLETHLKELVLKSYDANEQDVCFAKFFVLNAKVLKKIKFGVSEKLALREKSALPSTFSLPCVAARQSRLCRGTTRKTHGKAHAHGKE
jgi:hypothetical protein